MFMPSMREAPIVCISLAMLTVCSLRVTEDEKVCAVLLGQDGKEPFGASRRGLGGVVGVRGRGLGRSRGGGGAGLRGHPPLGGATSGAPLPRRSRLRARVLRPR